MCVHRGTLFSTETVPVNFLRLVESSSQRAENGLWYSLLSRQLYQYTIPRQRWSDALPTCTRFNSDSPATHDTLFIDWGRQCIGRRPNVHWWESITSTLGGMCKYGIVHIYISSTSDNVWYYRSSDYSFRVPLLDSQSWWPVSALSQPHFGGMSHFILLLPKWFPAMVWMNYHTHS